MKHDYDFFEQSLHTLQRKRSNTLGSGYLLDTPKQLFPEQDFEHTIYVPPFETIMETNPD